MTPSREQIRRAAYFRWERRGGGHGADVRDWLDAEQELLFLLNYEVIARHRPGAIGDRPQAPAARKVCRFCERAAPQTTFSGAGAPATATISAPDECDECLAQFRETISADFERFSRPYCEGRFPSDGLGFVPIPIGAFKGLVKTALSLLPRREIPPCEDAIEWVSNPDHDVDGRIFRALDCRVLPGSAPATAPWAALARRTDDDAPMPYLLVFAAIGRAIFQAHVPLCSRDDDLEGTTPIIPRVPADIESFLRDGSQGHAVGSWAPGADGAVPSPAFSALSGLSRVMA
jgi:hypothetical protein